MNIWFVLDESGAQPRPTGPFSLEQMRGLWTSGALQAGTRVARSGSTEWSPAAGDPELASLFATTTTATPSEEDAPPVGARLGYSFANAFSEGWAALRRSWGVLVLTALAYLGCWLLINIPYFVGVAVLRSGRASPPERSIAVLLMFTCWIAAVLLGPHLMAGLLYAGVRAMRGSARVSDLMVGFRRYGGLLGTGMLFGLIVALLVLGSYLVVGVGVSVLGLGNGHVLSLIVGIPILILGVGLAVSIALRSIAVGICSLLLLVDPNERVEGGMPAIREAWRTTKPRSGSLVGLAFVLYLIVFASALALCVGVVLFGIPLAAAVAAAAYLQLRREAGVAPST